MNTKGLARMMWILIIIIVILAAGLVGVGVYYLTRPQVTAPPGEFAFSNLTVSPTSVTQGTSVTVTVNVTNTGGSQITGVVTLLLNNVKETDETITLAGGASRIVTFTVTKNAATYNVTISGSTLTAVFTVAPPPPVFVQNNEFIFEDGATYQWLDPHVSYYQYDYWILWHSVETLLWYERDNSTKIIPWLAESYTVSGDSLHYNITLRQGITFQDGTPFNATAVWFSLNRIFMIDGTSGTGTLGSQAAWMIQQLSNTTLSYGLKGALARSSNHNTTFVKAVLDQKFVEILGPYLIRLNLLTATTQFLPIMAGPWAAIISPTSTIQMDYQHLNKGTWDGNFTQYFVNIAGRGDTGLKIPTNGWRVGSGPYYIQSVATTAPYTIVMKAYDNYWGGPNNINLPPTGKTRIATITYKQIPSFTTRLLDLKAGTVTAIGVPTSSIFQAVDRDTWINQGVLQSIIPGVTEHGVFPQFTTWWLDFDTNVTNPDGSLKSFQPFADYRIRLAVSCSVNITDMNINVNNRFGIVANNVIPPGTAPTGSYNASLKTAFSFDLARATQLLKAANATPLTSFTYYKNGTAVPPGIVNNSFGPDYAHAKIVEMYVQSGADTFIAVLTTMSDQLNSIAETEDLGIRFNVVIVPGGQQYTLASSHLIDSYVGGWIADYNHVMDWLTPMYLSSGTYPSWNLWNMTALDTRMEDATVADQTGDTATLLRLNNEMNTIANEAVMYMVWWYPTLQFSRSSWLKGWYVNTVYGVDLWSNMYYEQP